MHLWDRYARGKGESREVELLQQGSLTHSLGHQCLRRQHRHSGSDRLERGKEANDRHSLACDGNREGQGAGSHDSGQ